MYPDFVPHFRVDFRGIYWNTAEGDYIKNPCLARASGSFWKLLECLKVEAAGIEPASASPKLLGLHV
jgi:hypothetical protein